MPSIEDLGRKYKKKHPECTMSDREAGEWVKAEYPLRYLNYMDDETRETLKGAALEVVKSISITREPPDNLQSTSLQLPQLPFDQQQTIKSIQEYYDPSLGRLRSWNRKSKSEAKSRLLAAINTELFLVLQQGAMLEEAALRSAKGKLEFQKFVASHSVDLLELKSLAHRIEAAIAEGLDHQSYTDINKTRGMKQVDLDHEQGLSDLKIKEYEARKRIDNEAQAEEHRIDHENISRMQQEHLELIDRATTRLFKLYDEKAALSESLDPAKEDKLDQLKFNIKIAEEVLRAEQTRFVQDTIGKKEDGFAEGSDSSRSDRETDTPVN